MRRSRALSLSLAWHVAVLFAIAAVTRGRTHVTAPSADESRSQISLVWLSVAGPGGGGGGGGSRQAEPARRLERPGRDRTSVPVPAPPAPVAPLTVTAEPETIERMTIPAQPLADSLSAMPGLVDAPAVMTPARGSGSGPGAGTGRGDGSGPGTGSGDGNGFGGGSGGDVYRPGNGVTRPIPIHIEQPRYSNDAMRARVQGIVVVECIVRVTGACSDIHVVHSLDPRFGLDEEAKRAAALWRFQPGARFGQPVPVAVRIELEFSVR